MVENQKLFLPVLVRVLKSIISVIESPEGLNPDNLKKVYAVLTSCCLDIQAPAFNPESDFLSVGIYLEAEYRLTISSYLGVIANIIFRVVSKKLDVSFVNAEEEFSLLLRCCLVILILRLPEQTFIYENCQVIFDFLSRLCSLDLIGLYDRPAFSLTALIKGLIVDDDCVATFSEDLIASNCILEKCDPSLQFKCKMLEVFLDELLLHRQLRQIMLVKSFHEKHRTFNCDIGSLPELLSAHFLISVSNEQTLEKYLSRFCCLLDKNQRFSELSLDASLLLLQNPVIHSAPKIIQAHLISLVCDAISITMNSKYIRLALDAFERSVVLYMRHVSIMWGDLDFTNAHILSFFDFLIQPLTRSKILAVVATFEDAWHSYLSSMIFDSKPKLLAASVAFIKKNEHIIDQDRKDDILFILTQLLILAFPDNMDNSLLQNVRDINLNDIFLLGSSLKVMGNSMLFAVQHLRYSGNMRRSLKKFSLLPEYEWVLNIISRFQQVNRWFPSQEFLYDAINSVSTKRKQCMFALLHFTSFLSFSFSCGLDFLVKGCLYVLMLLMSLVDFEDDALNALRSSLLLREESHSTSYSPIGVKEELGNQNSSQIVASRFQRARRIALRGVENEEEKVACSGEIFLKSILERKIDRKEYVNDLADFVECEPEKDYTFWLKNRRRFRKWKFHKRALLKRNTARKVSRK